MDASQILKDFEVWKLDQSGQIKNCALLFESIVDMANLKHCIYTVRFDLIDKKRELTNLSIKLQRERKTKEKDILERYKITGSKLASGQLITFKNNQERDIFVADETKMIDYFISTIDNNINWISDNMKLVVDMSYGITNMLELEKYKKSL